MEQAMLGFKAALAAVLAALTTLWGWFGWLVLAWIFCMAADYLTGTAAALKAGQWSAQKAREGLWGKVGCIAAVLIAGMLDGVVGLLIANVPAITLPWDYSVLLCPLVIAWYIFTELGSILEHVGALGAPIPGFLKRAVAALREAVDQEEKTS